MAVPYEINYIRRFIDWGPSEQRSDVAGAGEAIRTETVLQAARGRTQVQLRDASRDLVEAFINDLAQRAAKDRPGLICQFHSYAKSRDVAARNAISLVCLTNSAQVITPWKAVS
jgi:hypothetical protein